MLKLLAKIVTRDMGISINGYAALGTPLKGPSRTDGCRSAPRHHYRTTITSTVYKGGLDLGLSVTSQVDSYLLFETYFIEKLRRK